MKGIVSGHTIQSSDQTITDFQEKKSFFSEYWPWQGDEAMTFSCATAGSVSKMSLYQSQNGSSNILISTDYIDTEHIIEITPQNTFIKSSAVWEAHKKCLGNVLTLTCDLCLDIMAGGGPGMGGHRAGARLWWMSVIRMTQRPGQAQAASAQKSWSEAISVISY